MKNLLLALLIGSLAGIIDIIPMIIKKLDKYFIFSAFLFYLVLGLFNYKIHIATYSWLNGLVVGLILFIPQFFLIYKLDRPALPIILINTVILSSGVGLLTGLIIK